jgi:hypothetical protein
LTTRSDLDFASSTQKSVNKEPITMKFTIYSTNWNNIKLIVLAFPSEPKLKMLVSSGPKRIELMEESCAGQPVICRPADMSLDC